VIQIEGLQHKQLKKLSHIDSEDSYFDDITIDCGVTPHPQKTGISPALMSTASPKSGLLISLIPKSAYEEIEKIYYLPKMINSN
jgi:hypothetical protein